METNLATAGSVVVNISARVSNILLTQQPQELRMETKPEWKVRLSMVLPPLEGVGQVESADCCSCSLDRSDKGVGKACVRGQVAASHCRTLGCNVGHHPAILTWQEGKKNCELCKNQEGSVWCFSDLLIQAWLMYTTNKRNRSPVLACYFRGLNPKMFWYHFLIRLHLWRVYVSWN